MEESKATFTIRDMRGVWSPNDQKWHLLDKNGNILYSSEHKMNIVRMSRRFR